MRSECMRTSRLCALAAILLALCAPVRAGDGGGGDGGGGDNDRFKELPPQILDIVRQQAEERRQERERKNRQAHAAETVAALDGLAGGEAGDSVVTP